MLFALKCTGVVLFGGGEGGLAKTYVKYVTLDNKTSHKDNFPRNWDLYIIWELNKYAFH